MASFELDRSFLNDAFRLMASCPLCHTKYQPQLAKIIAEKDDAYLLHVPCAKCHSAVVALIFTNMFGVNSVGVLTDLTSDEVLRAPQGPVSADDVLDLYQALHSGAFSKVLNQ